MNKKIIFNIWNWLCTNLYNNAKNHRNFESIQTQIGIKSLITGNLLHRFGFMYKDVKSCVCGWRFTTWYNLKLQTLFDFDEKDGTLSCWVKEKWYNEW